MKLEQQVHSHEVEMRKLKQKITDLEKLVISIKDAIKILQEYKLKQEGI